MDFQNLSHFSDLTGCGVQVITPDGARVFTTEPFDRCEPALAYIAGMTDEPLEAQTKASVISGALQSYRFGGRFFFFSPIGLFHFASPIIQNGRHTLSAVGGPILVTPIEDFIKLDLEGRLPEGFDRAELSEKLSAIPRFTPTAANTLSEQLLINAKHLSDSEYLRLENADAPGGETRYSEYILSYFSGTPTYESILRFAEEHRRDKATRKHEKIVSAATEYIEQNYAKKISLEEVAAHVYVSPSYLSRILKARTGRSFRSLVNAARVADAMRLLEQGELSLGEIAFRTGFEDHSYFTKVFTRHIGIGPREYRSGGRGKNFEQK